MDRLGRATACDDLKRLNVGVHPTGGADEAPDPIFQAAAGHEDPPLPGGNNQ